MIWTALRAEAWSEVDQNSYLSPFLSRAILHNRTLEAALAQILVAKLAADWLNLELLQAHVDAPFAAPQAASAIRRDLQAIRDRDPAARGFLAPFLFFKGFQAIEAYREAHFLWNLDRHLLAVHLQNPISEVFAVDIHPAARLGSGILIDHATGVVIGGMSVEQDNVSLLHEVTLGGAGREAGDRHPKVRQGVLIGAGAKVLGNGEIGEGAKIGAGSVVLDPVPPHDTVAGVPARIIRRGGESMPALEMEQNYPHEFEAGAGV